jgi:hypothetical protein
VLEPFLAAGAPKPSSVVGAASIEEVMDLAARQYVDFSCFGIVDLDVQNSPAMTGRCWRW